MSALVRHDGVTLPLDTFIDAYRMVRVDRFALPELTSDARLMTVDATGTVWEDCRANQVDLPNMAAFRLIEGQQEIAPCHGCGTSADEGDICASCSEGDWGW
ncbi:MAG: hypothetical protein ABIV36_20930 [Sphingobium limneticum]